MNILQLNRHGLCDYTVTQLAHFFPDGRNTREWIDAHLDEALKRLQTCN